MARKTYYKYAHIYLTLGLVIVLLGFSMTYFTRLKAFSLPYHLHGISATLWMVLLIFQPYLFQKGKFKAHRYLGWSSLLLIPTIIICGIIMMRLMILGQANYPPNLVYKLAFIDACTLFGFAVLYVLAIYFRKKLKLHSKFMVATIFGPLIPALTRMFLFTFEVTSDFVQSLTYSYVAIELVILIMIWRERNEKETYLTYVPFLIFIIVQHSLMYFSDEWNWWKVLMDSFAGYSQ
ncbi:hypothetical protein [Winogradskyella aquimaris]|uniref:Uncharacterized protein n=1 Tax=Winogradskyella aquimaris TaxID=864074 RepID=A0ABU5ETZ0_9FLAO|nr:hypothetical protein [Winogradskyella aquimaris]MDY2588182.1 hypothetical protein [Winogradskyella aquimaris]